MAMTKWKMAGLALFASGVLASSALVSAQQSAAERQTTRAEENRLQAVEAKLDRLLLKFEAAGPSISPAPAVTTPGVPGNAGTEGPNASPKVGREPFNPQLLELRLRIEARETEDALKKEVRDRTAAELQKLGAKVEREVVTVNLVATKVTDDALRWLSVFRNLQTLYLHHTSISDAGVANLKDLKSLTTLDLFDTRVTDAALEHLAEWMPHLEWLELSNTQITDAGLGYLKGLKHLRRLDVRKTKVTDAGVEDLHRSLPGLGILHGKDH